jgi:HlyD family secretion protein
MAKKKKRWVKIVTPILVIIVLGSLVMANLNKKEAAVEVMAQAADRGRLVATVTGTGRVQPEVQVKISANVSGRITEIRVKEGDRVHKGDLLVRLDKERYEASVEQAKSSRKSAEAALEKSRSELARIQELHQRGMASQADLETALAEFQLRTAEVEQSQALLKQAQDDLAKTSIYAPMDGIVSLLNKEPGEIALGAQFQEDVILIIADLSKMEVVVEVDENDIVSVSLQDSARVKIDAYPDTTFRGLVREIAHTATTRGMGTAEELTNFEVKISLLETPPKLRPGMSATADIITDVREDAVRIPIQCVVMREPISKASQEKGGSDSDSTAAADAGAKKDAKKVKPIEVVFKVEGGVAHQVPVTLGISSETDMEILAGVAEGDTVVSGPFRTLSQKLKDGDRVKVKESLEEKSESREGNRGDGDLADEM